MTRRTDNFGLTGFDKGNAKEGWREMTRAVSLLVGMMVALQICAADGDRSAWMRARSENRPKFPSTYVAPKGASESLVRNSLSFEEEEDVARRSLPDSTSVRSWKRIVDTQGESLSVATIQPTDGVTWNFAVYNQLGNLVPYYWTGNGYPQVTESDRFVAAIRRLNEVLGKTVVKSQIAFVTNVLVRADTVISMMGGETVEIPFERSILLFVDDRPGANWAHPCRYVFFNENLTEFVVSYEMYAPRIRDLRSGARLRLKRADDDASSMLTLEQVKNAVYSNALEMTSNALSFSGDASRSHFVLISGGADPESNGIRFWADTAMMYSTLTKKYGVSKDHIHVYVSDGTSTGKDANLSDEDNPVLVSSPTDLDGDGSVDVDGAATKNNVSAIFSTLKGSLTSSDQLFVFITSHGSPDGTAGVNNHGCAAWLFSTSGQAYFWDTDLHDWTKGFACPVAFAIETCYSGGFIDDITQTANRVIATACHHYESSWGVTYNSGKWGTGGAGQMRAYNQWMMPFNSAVRGRIPKSATSSNAYPWEDATTSCNADSNGDGLVSFFEAKEYALQNDASATSGKEHPQYGESTTGLGDRFFVLKQGVATYSVAYKPGTYGTGSQQTVTKTKGVALTLKGAIFTRTGYTQTGWSTYSAGTSKTYNLGALYTTDASITLYPYWTANTYSVAYVLDGGTHGSTHPTSATYDKEFYVSAPTRAGYTFAGWTVTSGLNTSTAKWGTSSSPSSAIGMSTKCANGATGNVYFKNLTTGSSVKLTANWTAIATVKVGEVQKLDYIGMMGGTTYVMWLENSTKGFLVDDVWLEEAGIDISGGVTPAVMNVIGRNGIPRYESLLLGLDPESSVPAEEQLHPTITFDAAGKPVISCFPRKESELVTYTELGKRSIGDAEWIDKENVDASVWAQMKFFKVKVKLNK